MPSRSLDRSRRELSDFVRHRREGLRPADVGLPSGGRRRTKGLRREEVAALAGVGIAWYTHGSSKAERSAFRPPFSTMLPAS
jgi:hypothetical protein